jgi:phage shock protein C
MTAEKKLYRSRKDRRIAGVAGGLAEHFNIDPVIVRIAFVCAFLFGGGGLIVYIIIWIVTPEENIDFFTAGNAAAQPENKEQESTTFNNENNNKETINMENQFETQNGKKKKQGSLTGGLVLITIGVLFLAARFIPNIDFHDLWPIILIVIGISILFRNIGKKNQN